MLAFVRLFPVSCTGWSYNTPLFPYDRFTYVLAPLQVREVRVSCFYAILSVFGMFCTLE